MNIILVTILIFLLGTIIGSFLSVIVNRIIKKEKGVLFGRSKCPKCKKTLRAWQLIPIFSYIITGGKCAHCHKKISVEYPLIEIFTGLVLVFVYINFTLSTIPAPPILAFILPIFQTQFLLFYLFITALLLITITYFDLKIMAVPNLLLWIWLIVCAFSLKFTPNYLISHFYSLLIVITLFGGQILLSKSKWLGNGDFIFSLGIAALFTWELTLVFLVLSYLTGGIIAAILLISKKFKKQSAFPFLPFMAFATLLTIVWGTNLLNWYLNFSFFPY